MREAEKMNIAKTVVSINSETIGRGDDELGATLMRSFLYTLIDEENRPWRIIFINGGVKLTAEGSPFIDVLNAMIDEGTEVLSCGTSLDYFALKEKVRAGKVSNMAEIVSSFSDATKVVKP